MGVDGYWHNVCSVDHHTRHPTQLHSVQLHHTHIVIIIQILTGAEVNTEKLCPKLCNVAEGPRVTLHN